MEVRVGIKGSHRDRLVCFNTLTGPLGGSIGGRTGTYTRVIVDRQSSTNTSREDVEKESREKEREREKKKDREVSS